VAIVDVGGLDSEGRILELFPSERKTEVGLEDDFPSVGEIIE